MKAPQLQELETLMKEMDSNMKKGDLGYNSALILLAVAMGCSPTPYSVYHSTGIPFHEIRDKLSVAKKKKIFVREDNQWKIPAEWADEENGGVAFWLDCAVLDCLVDTL